MAFTFFFRDQTPLDAAIRKLIPAVSGRSHVRIWDAGCAMGQEPYTLGILLAENMGHFALRNVQIYATDWDTPLLATMKEAVYPIAELERVPPAIFQKYFEPDGKEGHFRVIEKIRNLVTSQHHNLLTYQPVCDGFSLIVCKNVLLHFQEAERIEVYKMFHHALEAGGLLVHEHTQKLPAEVSHLFQQVAADSQLFCKLEAQT